jgi:hypothetical protein
VPLDLEHEIAALEADPPSPLPRIQLRRGAGAYICGEESAMIESIEGKRGMPRLRPPYVAQVGLFGRPTLEHNMETLYWARDILEKGAPWFAGHGRHGRKGLRSFSVSGRVAKPGVHLAPAGITVRELIDEHCGGMLPGHEFYGYLPGGASGGILPASLGDVPLDFDTLQPHGSFIGSAAVVVLSHRDRARDAGAQPDAILRRRVVRSMHALPRGYGEGGRAHRAEELGPAAPGRAVARDGRRIDLRTRTGSAEPDRMRDQVFPRGIEMKADAIRFLLNGGEGRRRSGRDHHRSGGAQRRRDPASLLHAGDAPGRQLPRLHGGDQGRARAGAVVLPRAHGGDGSVERFAARAALAEDRRRDAGGRTCRSASTSPIRSSACGSASSASASRASPRAPSRRQTSRTRQWPSTSTRASSARAACAPAARSRSTT